MKLEIALKDGRKQIVESVETFKVIPEPQMVQMFTESKLFEINPLLMNRRDFEKPLRDQRQEWTRKIILEAFAEVDKYPEKYAFPFYTLIPEKAWTGYKTVSELIEYAKRYGGRMANWVQQSLEWAQRISNGESWKAICNNADTANWYRIITWKNGCPRMVGGSRISGDIFPASYAFRYLYYPDHIVSNAVPLVYLRRNTRM